MSSGDNWAKAEKRGASALNDPVMAMTSVRAGDDSFSQHSQVSARLCRPPPTDRRPLRQPPAGFFLDAVHA